MVLLPRAAVRERGLATAGGGAGTAGGKPQGCVTLGVGLGQRCGSSRCPAWLLRDENLDVGIA